MRSFLFALPVILAALGLFASTAAADRPSTATGTYIATGPPTVTDIRTAGPNTFITESVPALYAGDLSGPFVVAGVVHLMSDGSFTTSEGTVVCTGCTIGGRTGDFSAVTNIRGPSLFSGVTGHITITSTSGGLTGLHGTADFAGSSLTGTDSYAYHFEP
jgi:hypothetical protein